MDEQRRDHRIALYYRIKVLDPKTNHQIGHLSNLSENGCQIVIDHPIKENHTLQLALEDTLSMEGGKPLAFAACCKWCRFEEPQENATQASYDAGMEFRHLPTRLREFVQNFH